MLLNLSLYQIRKYLSAHCKAEMRADSQRVSARKQAATHIPSAIFTCSFPPLQTQSTNKFPPLFLLRGRLPAAATLCAIVTIHPKTHKCKLFLRILSTVRCLSPYFPSISAFPRKSNVFLVRDQDISGHGSTTCDTFSISHIQRHRRSAATALPPPAWADISL